MADIRISGSHLGKKYWLYQRYAQRIQQAFISPFIKKDFATPFWALQDVSFEVKPGEVLGIIGRNGSGKSTLLQIISGTLQPTTGQVQTSGRLTALLELGSGFHPEFTGRENIILSGATLGIPEREMRKHFDQIIDFSQIGPFIDQPVKLYSSGMYVRLAFSIATCVDPEILIVDEALAVGDAGFVIRCMDRMKTLKENGTAIVYVTHDIQTVRSFCDTVMWLNQGKIADYGEPGAVTSGFIQSIWMGNLPEHKEMDLPTGESSMEQRRDLVRWGTGKAKVRRVRINGLDSDKVSLEYQQPVDISIEFELDAEDIPLPNFGVGICIRNEKGLDIITSTTFDDKNYFQDPTPRQPNIVHFRFENILAPGVYALVVNLEDRSNSTPVYYDFIENCVELHTVANRPIFSLVLPEIQQNIE